MAVIPEVLKYSFVEGGAATFTEFEKQLEDDVGAKRRTKAKGSKTKVMIIDQIVIDLPDYGAQEGADDDGYIFQITSQSQSAILNISDKDSVFKWSRFQHGAVAAGLWMLENPVRINCRIPYLKKTIYFAVQGIALAAAETVGVEIHFHYEYMSDWQFSRMIARKN